jgi:hypothetical protein
MTTLEKLYAWRQDIEDTIVSTIEASRWRGLGHYANDLPRLRARLAYADSRIRAAENEPPRLPGAWNGPKYEWAEGC